MWWKNYALVDKHWENKCLTSTLSRCLNEGWVTETGSICTKQPSSPIGIIALPEDHSNSLALITSCCGQPWVKHIFWVRTCDGLKLSVTTHFHWVTITLHDASMGFGRLGCDKSPLRLWLHVIVGKIIPVSLRGPAGSEVTMIALYI